jgi:hypothetical protein
MLNWLSTSLWRCMEGVDVCRREWLASRPFRFNSVQTAPRFHRVGRGMGPRTGLNELDGRKKRPLPRVVQSVWNCALCLLSPSFAAHSTPPPPQSYFRLVSFRTVPLGAAGNDPRKPVTSSLRLSLTPASTVMKQCWCSDRLMEPYLWM